MREAQFTVINALGLHARAAAQLVRRASEFKSHIILERQDSRVIADAKSILSVLTLAATKGTVLDVRIDGEDEDAALSAMCEIFECGFGEL